MTVRRAAFLMGRAFNLTGDVHVLLMRPDGRVLFGRRQGTGFEDGAYHLPTGHLDGEEAERLDAGLMVVCYFQFLPFQ